MDAVTSLHPTDERLRGFGLGKLDDPSAEEVNRHLAECPDCRRRVAEMSADSFLDRVRDAKRDRGTSTVGQSRIDATRSHVGAATLPPPSETLPPGLADHPDYQVKRELGRGGMGVVYLAHNRLMGRDEVLKVMGREIVARPELLDRFLREIRAVARLRHPNIVTAFSAVRLGESIVFAMEHVEGLDLSKLVKIKGPMPVAHACLFAHQAALGLQHAHEEGLVHRDIKPGNLILSRKGDRATVKVLDFGLAKATREQQVDSALTREGQALGTPDYIAPEQILDAPNADIRADIYSLGGTLFYLLTGRPPFQATSLYDLYQAHISRDADPLNLLRPEVPAELAALVAKMMAKDPSRRFQTPGEVADALKPFFRKGNQPPASGTEVSRGDRSNPGQSRPAASSAPTQPATGMRPASPPQPSVETPRPESKWASLVDFRETERSVEGPSPTPPAPSKRPPGHIRGVAIAAGLASVLLLGGLAIWQGTVRVKTPEGVVVLENLPQDADVLVDGEEITVDWNGVGQPVKIRAVPGEHRLEITHATGTMRTEAIEFKAPGSNPVTVSVRLDRLAMPRTGRLATSPANSSENANDSLMHVPPVPLAGVSELPVIEAMAGEWSIDGNELVQSSMQRGSIVPNYLIFQDPEFEDYEFQFEGKVTEGNHGLKVVFHWNSRKMYRTFNVGSYGNQAHDLGCVLNGKWERQPGHYLRDSIAEGEWYKMKVIVRGDRVSCYLDDQLLFTGTDPRYAGGRVGIGTWGTAARFRRIKLTRADGNILFEGLPQLAPDMQASGAPGGLPANTSENSAGAVDSSIQHKDISIAESPSGLGMMSMPTGSMIGMTGGEPVEAGGMSMGSMMGMMGGEPGDLAEGNSGMMGMPSEGGGMMGGGMGNVGRGMMSMEDQMMGMMGTESPGSTLDGDMTAGEVLETGSGESLGTRPMPGDALIPGTTWLGTRSFRDLMYPGAQARCTLTITTRSGHQFAGTLIYVNKLGSKHQFRVTGEIDADGTRMSFLETGEGQYQMKGSGRFDGDVIDYKFLGTGIGGESRYGDGRMTKQ